jgi:multiple antibiotic resistance protein
MEADVNFYVQAIISVLVITDPLTRGIFFKALTEHEPERRREYIRKVTITVAIVLGVAALAGREILDLIGINLGAFGIAGGIVVALMGFEMLFGGEPSRAQGGKEAHEQPESFEGSVIVPCAIPFIAGPGAMTLVITLAASTDSGEGTLAALIAVAVAVVLLPICHLFIADKVSLSENAMQIATKFGGLIIATIGIQLLLNGIDTFFGIS